MTARAVEGKPPAGAPADDTRTTGWLSTAKIARFEHRVLALMLLSLHGVLWLDPGSAASRALLLTHMGLFLIWQPIWGRRPSVEPISTALFILIIAVFAIWFDWLPITFWILLLCGFVGGRVALSRRDRMVSLVALLFLVSELLVACVPPLAGLAPLPETNAKLFAYSFAFVPVALFALPDRGPGAERRNMDFLYGAGAAMLTAIVALGSLLTMFLGQVDYTAAVVITVLSIAVFMLALSFLWTPLAGSTGLGQAWQLHLQNIGTPFERWLGQLAALSDTSADASEFLNESMQRLLALPWVQGLDWRTPEAEGRLGDRSRQSFFARSGDVEVEIHTGRTIGIALRLHCNLLVELIAHLYVAKQRERALATSAHMRAVHETGARLTHDIKNLLQSLHAMTSILEHDKDDGSGQAQALVKRQLPLLRDRLEATLGKLQAPVETRPSLTPLAEWWERFEADNADANIALEAEIRAPAEVPRELFDRVSENLLENARFKRSVEPGINVRLRVYADDDSVELSVRDTGSAIGADTVSKLFVAPVASRGGLGIGLYQAAVDARRAGYRLRLSHNAPGNVRFVLARAAPPSVPEDLAAE